MQMATNRAINPPTSQDGCREAELGGEQSGGPAVDESPLLLLKGAKTAEPVKSSRWIHLSSEFQLHWSWQVAQGWSGRDVGPEVAMVDGGGLEFDVIANKDKNNIESFKRSEVVVMCPSDTDRRTLFQSSV